MAHVWPPYANYMGLNSPILIFFVTTWSKIETGDVLTNIAKVGKVAWLVTSPLPGLRDVQCKTTGGEFPGNLVSWETVGKSLSLGNSRVTGISGGLGNSCAMGNSQILEAITFLSGI